MEQKALEAKEEVDHEKDVAKNELQAALIKFKEELQSSMENAENAKKNAVNDALIAAEEKSMQLLERKERDLLQISKLELDDSIRRMNDETATQVAAAERKGEEKVKALERSIDELNIRHGEEKNGLENKIKKREKELEDMLDQRTDKMKNDLLQQHSESIEKVHLTVVHVNIFDAFISTNFFITGKT